MKNKHLTPEQRYTISQCHKKGMKQKEIAELINRSSSTVCRELKRNAIRTVRYNDRHAKTLANESIIEKEISLSHETIYKWTREDKQKGGTLYEQRRHKLKKRKHDIHGSGTNIPDRVSIHSRPKEVDGKRFGDFEMDTTVSAGSKSVTLTIVKKSTSMISMEKTEASKNAKEIAKVAGGLLSPIRKYVKSITTDHGSESAEHKYIAEKLKTTIFFVAPYASWQKGAIENANKLIRQYIPKSSDFSEVTPKLTQLILYKTNHRPPVKSSTSNPVRLWNN